MNNKGFSDGLGGGGHSVNLILPECCWEPVVVKEYGKKLKKIEEEKRPVLLVLCNEAKTHKMCIESKQGLAEFPLLWLEPLSQEAVQHWFAQTENIYLTTEELIQVMESLCGWPVAIYRLGELLEEQGQGTVSLSDGLGQTVNDLAVRGTLQDILPKSQMETLLRPVMKVCADMQESVSCEDMQNLMEMEGRDLGQVEYVMEWMANHKLLNRTEPSNHTYTGRNDKKKYYCIDKLLYKLWEKQEIDC